MLAIIGLSGGLLALLSNVPYVINTLKHKTKPHRVTWGIFFLLNIIFLGNHFAAGATSSLWLVIAFTISTFTIFALSFRYGVGGENKFDKLIIAGALIGVVIWQLLDAPIASIVANISVSVIAGLPTLKKAYKSPASETKIKWLVGSCAGLLTVLSVGELDLALLLLPVYTFIFQGTVFTLIEIGEKKLS